MNRSSAWALMVGIALTGSLCAQPASDARQERARALMSRLTAIEQQIAPAERVGPGMLAQARLCVRKLTALSPYSGDDLEDDLLSRLEKAISKLEQEKRNAAVDPGTGFQERAYISPIDGSPEPYLVYVPTNYDRKKSWPLLIFLHGYQADLTPVNWLESQYSPTLQEVCEKEGVILLLPFGRRNTEFMGIGESDVMSTIGYVQRDYNIDPRRIILSGASMGGSGAYSIACHHPDKFAAVVGISGRVDYYHWMNIKRDVLPQYKQSQIDADYARELLPNLLHVPVLVFHGENDNLVQITQSMMMESLLTTLKQQVTFIEIPGAYHNTSWSPSFTHEKFIDLLRNARTPENPAKVSFCTMTIKYPGAYWLRIEGIKIWGKMARVDAAVENGRLSLTTENVTRLAIGPTAPGFNSFTPNAVVNGQQAKGTLREDGRFEVTIAPPPSSGAKTPLMAGPIREAFDGPFLIVYPNDDKIEGAAADRDNAVRLLYEWLGCAVAPVSTFGEGQRRAVAWRAFKSGALPLMPDSTISDNEIKNFNLILCGSPATNKVLAKIADKLPLKIENGEYRIGENHFPITGNGAQCIFPNPLNPERYVLVVHGVQWGPALQVNHKLDFLPDFIIYSGETVQDDTMFPTNRALCAGYFDQGWKLSPDSTWVAPTQPAKQ